MRKKRGGREGEERREEKMKGGNRSNKGSEERDGDSEIERVSIRDRDEREI